MRSFSIRRLLLASTCAAAALLAAGCIQGLDSPFTSTQYTVVVGTQSYTVNEGATANLDVPVGSTIQITAPDSESWTLTAGTNVVHGWGNTLNLDGTNTDNATVTETTTEDPTSVWSATISDTAQLAATRQFSLTASSNPGTTFVFTLTN